MKLTLLAISNPITGKNFDFNTQDVTMENVKSLVGKYASICYSSKNFDEFINEPSEESVKRADNLLRDGHHSPFDQIYFTFYVDQATKITLMALNGGNFYATEEGSDRYRPMKLSNNEQQDFDFLTELYKNKIKEITPNPCKYIEKTLNKKAIENARYCMPTDMQYKNMFYTVSLRELNYLYNWAKSFKLENYDPICKYMVEDLKDFTTSLEKLGCVDTRLKDPFNRGFRFFKNKTTNPVEEFGYNYCMKYVCSIACGAQLERHKFNECHFALPKNTDDLEFYIPNFIVKDLRKKQEVESIYEKYRNRYPQGSLGTMTETGNIDKILRVLYERDCGMAQYETNDVMQKNVTKYINGLEANNFNNTIVQETMNDRFLPFASSEGKTQITENIKNLEVKKIANNEYIEILKHYQGKQYCEANGHCKNVKCGWAEGQSFATRPY